MSFSDQVWLNTCSGSTQARKWFFHFWPRDLRLDILAPKSFEMHGINSFTNIISKLLTKVTVADLVGNKLETFEDALFEGSKTEKLDADLGKGSKPPVTESVR